MPVPRCGHYPHQPLLRHYLSAIHIHPSPKRVCGARTCVAVWIWLARVEERAAWQPMARVIKYENGDRFEGECVSWEDNTPIQGMYRHATTGETYTGTFLDGKRHGLGKVAYKTKDTYEGTFVYGHQVGNGKVRVADDGTTFEARSSCEAFEPLIFGHEPVQLTAIVPRCLLHAGSVWEPAQAGR